MKRDNKGRFTNGSSSMLDEVDNAIEHHNKEMVGTLYDAWLGLDIPPDRITHALERFRDFFEKNGLWVLFYLAVLYAGYTWLKWH